MRILKIYKKIIVYKNNDKIKIYFIVKRNGNLSSAFRV